jgi:hypothetical protein
MTIHGNYFNRANQSPKSGTKGIELMLMIVTNLT